MNVILVALICAIVGAVPLAIGRVFIGAVIAGVVYFLIGWPILYMGAPSTVYPLFGGPGIMTFIFLWISGIIGVLVTANDRGYRSSNWSAIAIVFPIIASVIYIVNGLMYSGMFNASGYSSLLGTPEERVWTQDIQPKDPKHMLMGSVENALYQADKALGQAGAIGSQFQVAKDYITLQKIQDKWYYVAPLDYRGFSVWWSAPGIPAYIKVSAEDPSRQPELVKLEEKILYSPGAFFSQYLKRHLRYNGYLNSDMYEYLFEIDEDGNPWWVVPIFQPQLGWWGEKLTEVAQINPSTGEIKTVKLEEIPAWMDRVFPGGLIEDYLDWRGRYHRGWWNTWWGTKDLTESQKPILIYGADGEPYWVSGITSTNANDNSLVALAYSDARTGKTVMYKVEGGATEEAVVEAVDNNEDVKFKQLHGVNPQIYNCYGTMAAVVPLLNQSHIFSGVALVDIMNPQRIAVGGDQYEALRHYQRLLAQSGQQIAIDNTRTVKELEGVVERIGFDPPNGVYYILLKDVRHLFTLDATDRPKLPITKEGDKVSLKYEDSGEKVMPVIQFDNLMVTLEGTAIEDELKAYTEQGIQAEANRVAAPTIKENVRERLEDMTPEQLKQLESQLETNSSQSGNSNQ